MLLDFFFKSKHAQVKKAPLLKICHTYPTMMKFGTFIS